MHGNPLIRVFTLTAALAIMALVVASITRGRDVPSPSPTDPGTPSSNGSTTPAMLTVQFSAPARSFAIRSGESTTVLVAPHQPEGIEEEFRFDLPVRDQAASLVLDLAWASPAPNRFLRLILETDSLPTRELTLHAPDDLEDHAINVLWTSEPESLSP